MSDFQAIADRFGIEELRGGFTDALMMHDSDQLTSPFIFRTLLPMWRRP